MLESAAIAVPSELSEDDITVRSEATLTPEGLIEHCVERMPRYVEPREEPLPRTPSKKIAKDALREAGVSAATWDRGAQPSPSASGGR